MGAEPRRPIANALFPQGDTAIPWAGSGCGDCYFGAAAALGARALRIGLPFRLFQLFGEREMKWGIKFTKLSSNMGVRNKFLFLKES